MADRIEMWPIERPNARNARTHSEAQVAQIAVFMLESGVNNPLSADSQAAWRRGMAACLSRASGVLSGFRRLRLTI
jgi:hypothetical protein